MTRWLQSSLVSVVLAAVASLPLPAQGREFRLGIISDKPVERKIAGYAPFARYVAERLKAFGVTGGKVVVAEDFDQMVQKIRKKEVDVVLESAFSAIELGNKTGMKPKLLVWKHGISEYSTLFFVRKDSPISSLKDLKGKVLALQDPYSTSGFLVPVAELRRNGIEVASSKDSAAPAVVRYVLVEHEKNQAFWVLLQPRFDQLPYVRQGIAVMLGKGRDLPGVGGLLQNLASFGVIVHAHHDFRYRCGKPRGEVGVKGGEVPEHRLGGVQHPEVGLHRGIELVPVV